jgi:hypothetical protein
MVIHTEYRGQRYSMGSSDPLPARFEIRFGGLNFQTTGNGYLMRLTNREELRARRQAGSALVTAARAVATPAPASTDAVSPSPPLRPALASGAVGVLARSTCRRATRCARQHNYSRPSGGALGLWTALPHRSARRRNGLHRQHQHQHGDAQGSPWPPRSGCQGP